MFLLVQVRDVIEGIEKLIPSFRGVKFTGTDLMDLGQCVSYCLPEWSILYGVDEVSLFLSSLFVFRDSCSHCCDKVFLFYSVVAFQNRIKLDLTLFYHLGVPKRFYAMSPQTALLFTLYLSR